MLIRTKLMKSHLIIILNKNNKINKIVQIYKFINLHKTNNDNMKIS